MKRCLGSLNSTCIPCAYLWTAKKKVRILFLLHSQVLRALTKKRELTCVAPDNLFSLLTYVPPVAHGSPMLLEGLLTLPPSATLRLSLEVTKSFLRYTEHPPDAQRGWDLPPAVLMPVRLNSSLQHQHHQVLGQRIYTSPLLVDLATPDFSMPYHVIIMTCTLITLIFGTIFNLLTRRFVVLRIEKQQGRAAQ